MKKILLLIIIAAQIIGLSSCQKDDGVHLTFEMVKGEWQVNDKGFGDETRFLVYNDSTYYLYYEYQGAHHGGHQTDTGMIQLDGNLIRLNTIEGELKSIIKVNSYNNDNVEAEITGFIEYEKIHGTRVNKEIQ